MEDKIKKLDFKDFITVDHAQMDDDLIAYRRKRLKNGAMHEELDQQQRRKAGQRMKRLSKRIQMAKKRTLKRAASTDQIDARARRQARNQMTRKMAGGKNKSDLSIGKRKDVEKRINKQSNRLDALTRKMRPQVRKMDRDRRASANKAD